MPTKKQSRVVNTFVKGLITEANPLSFPENASKDEDNLTLKRNGSRIRRLGMDFESGYSFSSAISNSILEDGAVSSYEWKNVSNSGSTSFLALQIGSLLYIHNLNTSAVGAPLTTIDLNTFISPYASSVATSPVQMASGKGALFVVSKSISPFYITYTPSTGSFTTTAITLTIRDFIGLEDGLSDTERPTAYTAEHWYNLYNQGWPSSSVYCWIDLDGYTKYLANPLDITYNTYGWYPSKSDIYKVAKFAGDEEPIGLEAYNPQKLLTYSQSYQVAGKGRFKVNAFSKDFSTASGISGLPIYNEQGRPSTISFFAGRLFYSGVESSPVSPNTTTTNSYIYFSQILENINKVGECYQEADPTSEDVTDIVATDGGVLQIPQVGVVLRLIPMQNYLLVIADNGVWAISGNSESGFDATGYQVKEVTTVGAYNAFSVVNVESAVVYWGISGIYSLEVDPSSRDIRATNISKDTIQTYYDDIATAAKQYSKGIFDPINRRVRWLYTSDEDFTGTSNRYLYNKELILDVTLGAFYPSTISEHATTPTPKLLGAFVTPPLAESTVVDTVVIDGVSVAIGGDTVNITSTGTQSANSSVKYICNVPTSGASTFRYTFCEYNDTTYREWKTYFADTLNVRYEQQLISTAEDYSYGGYFTVLSKDASLVLITTAYVWPPLPATHTPGTVHVWKHNEALDSYEYFQELTNQIAIFPTDYIVGKVTISDDNQTIAFGLYTGGVTATRAGVVAIYEKNNEGLYILTDSIYSPNTATQEKFGWDLDISSDGRTLIISDPFDSLNGTGAGQVFVYNKIGTTWTNYSVLNKSTVSVNDNVGYSVRLSGNGLTAFVGSNLPDYKGEVLVFVKDGVWPSSETQVIRPLSIVPYDYFGSGYYGNNVSGTPIAVSEDGSIVAIGAYGVEHSPYNNDGSVFIFTKIGSTWSLSQTLLPPTSAGLGFFGFSLSLSSDGEVLAIGQQGLDSNGYVDNGASYLYKNVAGVYVLYQTISGPNADYQYAGFSIAISGNGLKLAVGVSDYDSATYESLGEVLTYDITSLPDGLDMSSYLITGHDIVMGPAHTKQATYITCFFNQTETQFVDDGEGNVVFDMPSGCYLQAHWGWTTTDSSNKWSSPQQVYRLKHSYMPSGTLPQDFDNGESVVTTKNKLRGSGKALSLKFYSEDGKDMQLLGWESSLLERGSE